MFVSNGTISLRSNWFVGNKYRNLNVVVGEHWKDRVKQKLFLEDPFSEGTAWLGKVSKGQVK